MEIIELLNGNVYKTSTVSIYDDTTFILSIEKIFLNVVFNQIIFNGQL